MFLIFLHQTYRGKTMQDIVGILLIFMGAASGLLFQDPVVCRFTERNQCSVALRQQLHLQIPLEDSFNLEITDKTFTNRTILKYRKTQSNPPTPNIPGWQFVNDNKTLILTSAERSDSGTYTLVTFDAGGSRRGIYTLQLNIEAAVSSVSVSDNCLVPNARKVYCYADGDNLHFNWTSEFIPRLENGSSTLVLNKNLTGRVTCHVKNNVSNNSHSFELQECPNYTPHFLGLVCVLLIILSVLAFYIYKKKQGLMNKEAQSQDDKEIAYGQVTHLPPNSTATTPAQAQGDAVEYATVVTNPSQRNQKKKGDEVQYGELVFNNPAEKESKMPNVREECLYSEVKLGQ